MYDIIETVGLTCVFRDRRVVDDLDLRVAPGEIYGLLGPNGAGKTTTIRMLTTLLSPSAGRAFVCGLDVARHAAEVRQHIGYVSQEKGVRYLLTGRESVEIEADLNHIPREFRNKCTDEVLGIVGLGSEADDFVANYSGGMQKRLDLACGLLHLPDILILDEPTLGLDVQSRHRIWEHISQLRDQGVTVLLATNYLDEADRLCDRITIIDHGREVVTGAPAALKQAVGADVVEVSAIAPDKLRAALADRPWVRRIATTESGDLHIFVAEALTAIPEVMRASLEHGADLRRIGYSRPTLDDVFLLHTGRDSGHRRTPESPTRRDALPVSLVRSPPSEGAKSRIQEIRALVRRWHLQLTRERLHLVFTMIQPAIWLVFFGTAIGRTVNPGVVGTSDYIGFMLPAVIAFTVVGTGISGAIPLLWDKETGYLNKLMSMPIARSSLLISRLSFQMTLGAAQALITLVVAIAMGVRIATNIPGALLVLVAAALLAVALTALFMALAYHSAGHDTFFAITGFVTLPILFTSSAFVPLDAMPAWMAAIARINPLTSAIESIRILVLEGWRPGLVGHLSALAGFSATCLALGTYQFRTHTGGR
jgi:ABC-type multidrug transport system ATPase subunit/ABC-type multidrug transport system permease subunit